MLLSDAIDQYAADRQAKGIKRSSLRSELVVLRYLLADVGNIHVNYLTPNHMDKFWFKRSGQWGPATFNRAKTQLNTFFKWCQVRGYMPRSTELLEGLRKRKVPVTMRQVIPQSRFEELLGASANERDRAVIALGLYLFTRVSETAALQWKNIDLDNQIVGVYRIKTDTYDDLPMCEELEQELRRWRLAYAAEAGEMPQPNWYVTPPFSGTAFTAKTEGGVQLIKRGCLVPTRSHGVLARPIKLALAQLGVCDKYEGGHTLRRSGAIALYHQLSSVGHDRAIRMCQAMLGHASIQTTEIYLRLDLDRKARNDLLAGKRMFPEAKLADVVKLEAGNGQRSDRAISV